MKPSLSGSSFQAAGAVPARRRRRRRRSSRNSFPHAEQKM